MSRYKALALQTACYTVNAAKNKEEALPIMFKTLERIEQQIMSSKAFVGQALKLVVLPEYFLTGFPMGETLAQWRDKACVKMGDEICQKISAIALKTGVYVSGNFYEIDENFPELYFQSSFIVSAEGEFILRYRRLNSMFAPTPHDVWDKYLAIYGYESLFPVAKTPLGNLACIASEEILYPEIARCLMMRGAEIFLHSSSEVSSPRATPKNITKQARAIENMAYVISANSAGMKGIPIPEFSTDGHSQIVHYEGHILIEAGQGETMVANANIDLEALRYHRKQVGMSNFIARQRFELYAESYANTKHYPANNFPESVPDKSHFVKIQQAVINKLFNE